MLVKVDCMFNVHRSLIPESQDRLTTKSVYLSNCGGGTTAIEMTDQIWPRNALLYIVDARRETFELRAV